jgi:DNA segregation ATPase FtsK/SpoIIIE-like protein
MHGPTYIDRPPRIQPEVPFAELEIPKPPEKKEDGIARLLQIGLPMVSIIGFVLVASLGGAGRSPLLLVPMTLSVVASTAYALYSFRKEKQRLAEIRKAYADRLVELNKEMHKYHDLQRRAFHYNYPDPNMAARIVRTAREELRHPHRTLRSETRLWERRVSDADFGVVRLGIGTLPSTVTYKIGEVENFDDPQVREAMKLDSDSRFVPEIPVILSFRQPSEKVAEPESEAEKEAQDESYHPPTTHALGIVGEGRSVYEFVRALLAHYVVFHAPMDARLYVLASQRAPWRWTEALPHNQGDEQSHFHCFLDAVRTNQQQDSFDEGDGTELEQFLEGIRKVLAQRKIRLQEHDENVERTDPTLPLLLIVVDLLDAVYSPNSPLRNIESDAAISILLEEGASLGAAVIFLVPERSKVPSDCRSVVEIERTTSATNGPGEPGEKPHFRFAETGLNTTRLVGEADCIVKPGGVEELAQQLAALHVLQGSGANLTASVPFLDLMGYKSLQELGESSRKKWQDSIEPRNANPLRVKLGLMPGNKPRTLVLSARRDGVHGMVAGSTGSGKSELLISLIIGLAVTYDPTMLNFVLVDYKGGNAFNEFKKLPHCVDVVTNLGEDSVIRMFTAIRAELERRLELNRASGVKNILEYRQRGYHQTSYNQTGYNRNAKPYPYLFIIIDEFAEMISHRAEFKAQLETITSIGRDIGVFLVLAAQQPSGVTDQMRSNIRLRICLRVESEAVSREMLHRSDAAFLPGAIPGRGFLQVGNEEVELVQVAYTGDRYTDPNETPRARVIWPDRSLSSEALQEQEPPELYKAIIDMFDKIAKEQGISKQLAPWPGFLPKQLSLIRVLVSDDPVQEAVTAEEYLHEDSVRQIMLGQPRVPNISLNPAVNKWFTDESGWEVTPDWRAYAMRPVVGLVDHPYAAKQLPLQVDFRRGHVAIFGASGWGKTTFLRSLIISLAATHSPDNFHTYVLDLGSGNLDVLAPLPHVGALIIPGEEGYEERTQQLFREIEGILERRKTLLNNAQVPDIYEYNYNRPEDLQPAILIVIDNFSEFTETFGGDSSEAETVLDRFVALIRQAKPCAVHFAITANSPSELSSQIYNLFTERFVLKLSDPAEYRIVVGDQVPDIRDIPGRGYTKIEGRALSFQVAGIAKPEQELERLRGIVGNIDAYARSRQYNLPVRVDALPREVLLKQLLAKEHRIPLDKDFLPHLKVKTRKKWDASKAPANADWLKATIGVVSGNRPRLLEFAASKDGVHGMIAGSTGMGKSELLMTLIMDLALNYDPSVLNFVLVDYKGGGTFEPFRKLPHCVEVITNLNKSETKRVFTSIKAELRRRQKLNAQTGTKSIVEYQEKGFHVSEAAYPHLFIIIDEYTAMISDNSEFREELDMITGQGRAQGVNLLLASQRPSGVSDQMRANIKLRISLRVEGLDASREMLRRPDAAFLPSGMPGRGYLQVGSENIELMQVAYVGEEYKYAPPSEDNKKPRFFEVITKLAEELLEGERPQTPWPPFLPSTLTFVHQLEPAYLDPSYQASTSRDGRARLEISPFIKDWLDGQGSWDPTDWHKIAMRAVVGLLDDPQEAQQMPLVVDFTKGHAVLFGASGWGKTTFIRSLIVSLASRHSPDEFHAHVLSLGSQALEVLKKLPHVGTVIMPDEAGYEERIQQLWRELNDVVDARKRLFGAAGVSTLAEYNSAQGAQVEPAILVAIDNFTEYIEAFGSLSKENDPDNLLEAFVSLARQGKAYGLHFVASVNRLNAIPSKVYSLFTERLTLRLADSNEYSAIIGGQIGNVEEITGRGYTRVGRSVLAFQVAMMPDVKDERGQSLTEARTVQVIGEKMAQFIQRNGHAYNRPLCVDALPTISPYRQVLSETLQISHEDKSFLRDLKSAMAKRWKANASAEHADWLQATVGVTSGNRNRTLHFEASRDGTHGMIAGGTGSGKSALLRTLILGLAVNYPPSILNFVLVDYKGGGTFQPFENLPHCIDIVTNLKKAAVDRMFSAISAEIRRRQALNVETRTEDIIAYRRDNLHMTRPYPHLFIIIDEYAEMIEEHPEYKPTLDSITRVGRAQGINLILASQQPKGVSDQMRANIKLRLCLRVEQVETSRELLRRPDAAFLPKNLLGRGYLQAKNENLELIQISYSGAAEPNLREPVVLWPDPRDSERNSSTEEPPKLFDAVVALSSELTKGVMAPKPWPRPLPESFSLESPLPGATPGGVFRLEPSVSDWLNGDTEGLWPGVNWRDGALCPAVGLVDNPAEASQAPLQIDLSRNHLAVFGDSGLGKSTFLRTLLVSLAATHSPEELHTYVLDLGGQNFQSLKVLPHMGAIIGADEEAFEERLRRLLELVERTIEERQQRISAAGASGLYDFNARFPDQLLPAIVIAIDNVAELHENHETLVQTRLIPLVRRSLGAGITFVVSGNLPANMPGKMYNLFGERITFQQSDTDRYIDIVGRGAIEIEDIPGRGYIRRGQRPLLFHAALPVGIKGSDGQYTCPDAEELRLLTTRMHDHLAAKGGPGSSPDPINILPAVVSLRELLKEADAAQSRGILPVLGKNDKLEPALFDLRRMGPHFSVIGPPLSGKTTTLHSWILSLASRYSPQEVRFVLVDTMQGRLFQYGGKHNLGELPHVLAAISEVGSPDKEGSPLNELERRLTKEGEILSAHDRARPVFVVIDNFDDFSEEIGRNLGLIGSLSSVARRFGGSGIHFVISGPPDGSINDLRRRVQASHYGLGLRSMQAVEAFRGTGTLSALLNREFPPGRGYIIKSGRASMIQVATPYAGEEILSTDGDSVDEERHMANALDGWVELISTRYPGQRADWSPGNKHLEPSQKTAPKKSARLKTMMSLVQSLRDLKGHDEVLGEQLLGADTNSAGNEEAIMKLLRDVWVRTLAEGLTQANAEEFVASADDDSVLVALEEFATRDVARDGSGKDLRKVGEGEGEGEG